MARNKPFKWINVRVSPEHREFVERVASKEYKTFGEVVEDAIDCLRQRRRRQEGRRETR